MTGISRRNLILTLGSACVAWPAVSRANDTLTHDDPILDELPNFDDGALERVFVDNSEPLIDGDNYVVKGLRDYRPLWWEVEPLEMAEWPSDEHSIDYAHLRGNTTGESFPLSDAVLRRLVKSHSYAPLQAGHSRVLLGIRGARKASNDENPEFADRIELVETRPDHFDYRCLLGIWDTAARKVWAVNASTVPHVAYLRAQRMARTIQWEANMMPTGMYRYRVGTHRNRSANFQPGAFRPESRSFAVIRCVRPGTLILSNDQYWDMRPTNHGDNIHAGTYSTREDRPKYFSAGCQVIAGYYSDSNRKPQGDWARFRVAAGLQRTPTITRLEEVRENRFEVETSEDGTRYSYILTTGRDLMLEGMNRSTPTLRYGSRGSKVSELQAALGLPAAEQDGIFGLGVQTALLHGRQAATPVVGRQFARSLGMEL